MKNTEININLHHMVLNQLQKAIWMIDQCDSLLSKTPHILHAPKRLNGDTFNKSRFLRSMQVLLR